MKNNIKKQDSVRPKILKASNNFIGGSGKSWRDQMRLSLKREPSYEKQNLMLKPDVVQFQTGDVETQPELADEETRYMSVEEQGELFVDGISYTDVLQGGIGTCYFMAALAAVAKNNPQKIRELINPIAGKPGHYEVRFYRRTGDNSFVRDSPVEVTAELPVRGVDDSTYLAYGGAGTPTERENTVELWPALLEKAYAQWKTQTSGTGYHDIERGNPRVALETITGMNAESYSPTNVVMGDMRNTTPEECYKLIESSLNKGKPVTAHDELHANAVVNCRIIIDNADTYRFISVWDPHGHEKEYLAEDFVVKFTTISIGRV